MLKIHYLVIVLGVLLSPATSSAAQVSIGIGLPRVSIGINLPAYPELVPVPGYPVYYAPRLEANYFFYDGMYWVYQDDNWYQSSWYNGPWWPVDPETVPMFVLRIPVRYYRQPPAYFLGWRPDAPPRWGDHWGHDWEQHRSGWDRWQRSAAPAPAPLPIYQRQYPGNRYPQQLEQQHEIQNKNYRYQPRDPIVRQHIQAPADREAVPQGAKRPVAPRQDRSVTPPPASSPQERPEAQMPRREPQMSGSQGREAGQQGKDGARKPKREQGQEQERARDRNE
ncbi:hypothetical protein GALL_299440 [mine drainage metagenome]|uniref:Uncharacterized protein n=1 Tax=mine drainage metagenome TaxID=410659 RepID=A0A1J5R7Y4_9ZZZZ